MRFSRGLLWGGLIGSLVGMIIAGQKAQQKPMPEIESSPQDTPRPLAKTRRRMLNHLAD